MDLAKTLVASAACWLGTLPLIHADAEPTEASRESGVASSDELAAAESAADRALEIVNLVMKRHYDPPARQQMLLDGVRAVYRSFEKPLPSRMGEQVSALKGPEQERAFLIGVLQQMPLHVTATARRQASIADVLCHGLLSSVLGEANFLPAKEAGVQEQLRSNRYVGIGVALGMKDKLPAFLQVFPQGAAYQGGIKNDDQIIEIDGAAVSGMRLDEVVDLLRGPEGSTLSLLIRRGGNSANQAISLRRGVVRFDSAFGYRRGSDGAWEYLVGDSSPIAYIQLSEIRPSTLEELRQIEQRLKSHKLHGLVLDLRFNSGGSFHDALLLADGLLPEAEIGGVRDASGERQYPSNAECLFRDCAVAVLINYGTSKEVEWLAAALNHGRGARLVGSATAGQGYSVEHVPLPDDRGALELWTKVLLDSKGRSLLHPNAPFLRGRPVAAGDEFGLQPDVKVPAEGGWLEQWLKSASGVEPGSSRAASKAPPVDPQLQAALRALSENR